MTRVLIDSGMDYVKPRTGSGRTTKWPLGARRNKSPGDTKGKPDRSPSRDSHQPSAASRRMTSE